MISIYQVDAFTNEPFRGNPAAVCLLQDRKSDDWMQKVAREMNLSETAFLLKGEDGFNLRWFTPKKEVELCGHATLASAHVLWEQEIVKKSQEVKFFTKSGVLSAKNDEGWIELNFPKEPEKKTEAPEMLIKALGVEPQYTGKNRFDYLVLVNSEEEVRNLKPDFKLLEGVEARGIIVTSHSRSEKYDFVSRFFAPAVGVNEDPVTGSAHCCLGPFWEKVLKKKEMTAYQASDRGGILRVRVGKERVYLKGQAVTIMKGNIIGG